MDKGNEKLVRDLAIVGVVWFGVVKPIKDWFSDDADKAVVDTVLNSPDSQNPFSPNFGVAYSSENGENSDYTTQSFNFIKNNYNDPANLGTDGVHSALPYIYWAEKIYRSMGFLWIDADTVEAGFAAMTSQYEVSQMAQWLLYKYDVDLFHWIKHGQSFTPWDNGVGDARLAAIVNHVKTLPVFDETNLIL